MRNRSPREQCSRGAFLIKAFFSLWAVMLAENISVRSVLTPSLFAALVLLFHRAERIERSARVLPLRIAAALYTAAVVLAVFEEAASIFDSLLFRAGVLFLLLLGGYFLAYVLLTVLVTLLDRGETEAWLLCREDAPQAVPTKVTHGAAFFRKHILSLSFLVCFLCYLPWFLYSYPGIFSPDPINQLEQVLGIEPLSNHHPVAHTALIGLWFHFGMLFTKDVTVAVSCYTLFQMTLLAFSAAVVVRTLDRELGLRLGVCLAALAFYALMPFMAVFSVLAGKDTVFASVAMLLVCELARILRCGIVEHGRTGMLHRLAFIVIGILFCLFRTNGWYAFLLFSICFLYAYRRKWRRALLLVLPVIAVAAVVRGPVLRACRVAQPDFAESIHIPMQQIAQVLAHDREIPTEDRALIERVIDTTYVDVLYVPGFADNIKELIRAGDTDYLEAHKADYLKLWLRLGVRYPGEYLSAWAAQIRGVSFPGAAYDVATIEGVCPNALGLGYRPLIGGAVLVKLRELVIKLGGFVPLYGLLWSAGTYSWLLLFAVALILAQGRNRKRLLLFVPGTAILCTLLIATPIASEFRYAFPCVALAPFGLCALLPSLRSVE